MLEVKNLQTNEESLKLIGQMAMARIERAKDSKVERYKHKKFLKTENMLNLDFSSDERKGRYRYVPPVFKIAFDTWVAGIMGAFRAPPFISALPKGTTPQEDADILQKVLDWNVDTTGFMIDFQRAIMDSIQAGIGVLKNHWMFAPTIKAVPNLIGPTGEIVSTLQEITRGNDVSMRVNPTNYYQDTSVPHNDLRRGCKWVAEVVASPVLNLQALLRQDGTIKKNVASVIKNTKEKNTKPDWEVWNRDTNTDIDMDFNQTTTNYLMWGYWPIKGNEDDSRIFHVVYNKNQNKVLRVFQELTHPYTLISPMLNNRSYISKTPLEAVIPINMLTSRMVGSGIENMIANLKRYIIVAKDGGITPRDLQNTPNNGYLGVDMRAAGVQQISQIVQELQGRDVNVGAMSSYLSLFNDWTQKSTSQPDLNQFGIKPSTGGVNTPNNATSANIIDNNLKTNAGLIMHNIGESTESHFDKKILNLQQHLTNEQIEEISQGNPDAFRRATTFGEYKAELVSNLKLNRASQLQNITNIFPFMAQVMTQAANMGQQVNLDANELLKEAVELAELPNKDKIVPPLPPQINTQGEAPVEETPQAPQPQE